MIFHILSKDLRRRKTMNAILLVFVIIAAMFTGSGLSNMVSVLGGLDRFYDMSNTGNIMCIFEGNYNENEIERILSKCSSVTGWNKELGYVYPESVKIGDEVCQTGTPLYINIDEAGELIFDKDNKEITEVDEGHIYLNKAYMDANHISTGEVITIDIAGKTFDLIVDGEMKDAVWGDPNMISNTRFLLNERDFKKIRNNKIFENGNWKGLVYYIACSDTNEVDRAMQDLDGFGFSGDRDMLRMIYLMDMMTSFILLALSGALILVSFVILRFSINFTLSEEFREIGVLKAIGLKNNQIRRLHTVKYAGIAVIGAAIGFFAGIPLADVLLKSAAERMVLENSSGIMPNIAGSIIIIVGIVGYAWHCTGKIKKFTPIDAIKFGTGGERFSGKRGIRIPGRRINTAVYMAFNDILSSPVRYLTILISFCLSTLIVLVLDNTAATLQSDSLMDSCLIDCDVVCEISSEDALDFKRRDLSKWVEKLEEQFNEERIPCDVYTADMMTLDYEIKGDKYSYLTVWPVDVPYGVMKYTEGTEPSNPEEIGLSSGIAAKLDIGIGDTIKVNYGKGKKDVIITGIFETFNNLGECIRLSEDTPIPMGSQGGVGLALIKYTDHPGDKDKENRAEFIRKNYGFVKVYEAWEFCAEVTGAAGPINAMKYLLLVIALIIVALVAVLMERTFIAAEKNQIALLKAIGFSDNKIVFWHVFRFAAVTLIAVLIATALSVPLTNLIMTPVFGSMGVTHLEYRYNIFNIFIFFPGLVLGMTIAASYMTSLFMKTIKSSDMANIE
ncbi:MAG: FtsX-like permease family protein [Lachnospiraceae bacterium]|nr:FtsX-like permease family protein [Lachnospiraceae bacterium]